MTRAPRNERRHQADLARKRVKRYEAARQREASIAAMVLSDEERYALLLLEPEHPTYDAIACALGMSRQNVQRIERVAISKIMRAASGLDMPWRP